MPRLSAILMSLTIVLCSMVQYHHHDREGNIFLYTLLGEFEIGFTHTHVHEDDSHECCHHHHHDSHCGDSESCSMHLDQLATHEQHFNLTPEGILLCVVFINKILPVWHIPVLIAELSHYKHPTPLPPGIMLPAWLMRGPPR